MYLNFKTFILYLQVYKQFVIRNFRGWNSTPLHDRGEVKINIVWVWWFWHHPSHQVTQHVVLRSEHNFLFRINAPIFPKKFIKFTQYFHLKNIYQEICCQFGLRTHETLHKLYSNRHLPTLLKHSLINMLFLIITITTRTICSHQFNLKYFKFE